MLLKNYSSLVNLKAYRAKVASPAERAKHNEQKKAYRAKVASPAKKAKLNEQKRAS